MPTAITASEYSIQLRDKDGGLKAYLTPFVSKVAWEWNRIGGCGRCSVTINKAYRNIIFDAQDDIQIRVKDNVNLGWDSYTKLMLHMNGVDASTTFTDEIGKAVTAVGNAQIDTAQSKFGGASGLFNGAGDYLSVPDSADWAFGTGDFTIDTWVRFNSSVGTEDFISHASDVNNYFRWRMSSSSQVVCNIESATVHINGSWSWTPSIDTWYHLALTRNGNNLDFYVNGVKIGSSTDVTGLTFPD